MSRGKSSGDSRLIGSDLSIMADGDAGRSSRDYTILTRADWIAAPAIAAFAAIILYFNIYSAINWDDLLYMSLSQFTWPEAWILNRYGHIYILKLFAVLAGDTITGARIYWCFMFFGTCTLTYWSAKILAGKKGVIVAIIAVLLIWIWPMFGREAGSPLSDFTVMLLVSLAVFIYIAFLSERTKHSHWFIILLGFIFVWAVKSKETGISIAVLFLGLGRIRDNFSIIRFIKDACWVICGAAAGLFLLMTCDFIFMGDFLFSVRPSSLAGLFGANLGPPVIDTQNNIIESWFAFFTTRPIFLVFILYLLVGWSNLKNYSTREKLIWVIPLFLMLFLTFSRRAWYVVPRYICPAVPVMAVWAAQFFSFDFEGRLFFKNNFSISKKAAALAAGGTAFILVIIFTGKITDIALFYKLDTELAGFPNVRWERMTAEELFYMLGILPIAVSGLLITAAISKKRGPAAVFLTALFLFAMILPAFNDGRKLLQTAAGKSRWRFEVCRTFKDDFKFERDTKIVVSKNVFSRTWLMGRDAQSHCHIFNIFFNQKLRYDQFSDGTEADIIKGDYNYAVLFAGDLINLRGKPEFQKLQGKFALKSADVEYPSGGTVPLVLLSKNENHSGNN
jgi:hypothetical protein